MEITLRASVAQAGRVIHAIEVDESPDLMLRHDFTLDTDESIAFEMPAAWTALTFLHIAVVLTATPTTYDAISYSTLDADGLDPANGTEWKVVTNSLTGWLATDLSALNKIYFYNPGAASVDVVFLCCL